MSEKKQLALIQLGGFAAVLVGCAIALAATVYAPALPALGIALASAISWYVGKLVAVPLDAVTMKAVDALPPAAKAELSVATVVSMAPAARQEAINQIVFLSSSRPPPVVEAQAEPAPAPDKTPAV